MYIQNTLFRLGTRSPPPPPPAPFARLHTEPEASSRRGKWSNPETHPQVHTCFWLKAFLPHVESEAMPMKSLIVIGLCMVAADKATGNLRGGSDFLTAVNGTRQLQEDEPFMPLANVYFIANEININQKTDLEKQADKLSPVLTGGFAIYERTRAFIALENPSGREITSFALGVTRDILPVTGLVANAIMPGAGTLLVAVGGIVLSVLDGIFGSRGSPQPTFEEQVADAFQQVQAAISNLRRELTDLILQVDQSLRTAILDREADNLRDRAQFAMNTFHTQILDIADSRMTTANETLRRVSSDARNRLMQEVFGNTQCQTSAGFPRHLPGSLEPEDEACRRFLWGLPVTYQLVFVSMLLSLELNPGQELSSMTSRFSALHARSLELLRFSVAGATSMSHLPPVRDACRTIERDVRFGVTLTSVLRCSCQEVEDDFYAQSSPCLREMILPYTMRRAQNLALTVNIGEILNITGDLCKRGSMREGRCISDACLARKPEDMPTCPNNWLDITLNERRDSRLGHFSYTAITPNAIWLMYHLAGDFRPIGRQGVLGYNSAWHLRYARFNSDVNPGAVAVELIEVEVKNDPTDQLLGSITTVYRITEEDGKTSEQRYSVGNTGRGQTRRFRPRRGDTLRSVLIHFRTVASRETVIAGLEFRTSSGNQLLGSTSSQHRRVDVPLGRVLTGVWGQGDLATRGQSQIYNLGIFLGPDMPDPCCDSGRVCESAEDVNCHRVSPGLCRDGLRNGDICCAASCGQCGGGGCSQSPGGADRCCGAAIRSRGFHCVHPGDEACIISESKRTADML